MCCCCNLTNLIVTSNAYIVRCAFCIHLGHIGDRVSVLCDVEEKTARGARMDAEATEGEDLSRFVLLANGTLKMVSSSSNSVFAYASFAGPPFNLLCETGERRCG